MEARRIIPHVLIFPIVALSMRRDVVVAQQPVEYATPGPYLMESPAEDCSVPKPVLIEPQPQVWVQPAVPMEMVPIMPLPESAGPSARRDDGADVWRTDDEHAAGGAWGIAAAR